MATSLIDDQDPSITYTGSWVVGGTIHEHDDTVSSSTKVGDHFSVPFQGTEITVFGTFDATSTGVKTLYSIDNAAGTIVTSQASGNGLDDYQQPFWQSGTLSSGNHTLVVTMKSINSDDGDGEGTIWFDYFQVTGGPTETPNTNTQSSPSGTSSSPSSSSASQSSASSSATNTSSSSPSPSSSAGAIASGSSSHAGLIGGVVGGVAVLILFLLCGLFFLRRRQRQQNSVSNAHPVYYGPNSGPGMAFVQGGTPKLGSMYSQPYEYGSGPGTPIATPPAQVEAAPLLYPVTSHVAHTYPGPQAYAAPASDVYPNPGYAPQAQDGSYSNSYQQQQHRPTSPTATSSSFAAGPSSSSSHAHPRSSMTSTADAPAVPGSNVTDLKRRQQEVVLSYEQGLAGSGPAVQHVDSGIRTGVKPAEIPPVYTVQ
ncbi:hypothetical protein FB45DRAFT_162416 [Roridomyces roridus]|uniref:Mid2 domain-containing protein n=1 Tax=Roridomyces roridus TaxID=1738132 RepID=A0AAD7BG48_9AGAR|nr:hypothetical protein FB45DRAFT_162416 [Roridomyces roridus]